MINTRNNASPRRIVGTGPMYTSRETIDQIVRCYRVYSMDEATLQVVQGPTGQGLLCIGGGVTPVKLTAKTNDTTYTGDVYGNGTDTTATETAVTIRVEDMATGETLPFGRRFSASRQSWITIGTPTTRTQYWTLVEVPRLL